jgi:hypothetical protein
MTRCVYSDGGREGVGGDNEDLLKLLKIYLLRFVRTLLILVSGVCHCVCFCACHASNSAPVNTRDLE